MKFILMKIRNSNRKNRVVLFFFITFILSFNFRSGLAQIPDRPVPPRLVNDYAGVLSASQQRDLEHQLVTYDDSTSTQIVIVTINKLGNYDISEFSYELGDKWGVGQGGKDNGIVITLSVQDRKVFIATGWGIEGFITDVEARKIIDQYMIPYFRQGDYYQGFKESSRVISEILTGVFDAEKLKNEQEGVPLGSVIMLIIIIIIIVSAFRGRGGGGGHINRRGWGGPIIIGGGGGFGGSGGFGGGGGFGGFGGGGFGGGGAGGSW